MAAYTSSQDGNWSSPSTWGGGGVPGDGDTASIGHNVTVNVNTTVGTSPNNTTTNVITITAAKTLTIATGIILTIKGNAADAFGSFVTFGAGAQMVFDASGSGGTPVYRWAATFSSWTVTGTSGSHCAVASVSGQKALLNGTWFPAMSFIYTDFTRVQMNGTVHADCAYSLTHSTFTACDQLTLASTTTAQNAVLEDLIFTSTPTAQAINLQWTGTRSTGTRSFQRNIVDKPVTYFSKNFTIRHNYFAGGITCIDGAGTTWDVFRHNFVKSDGTLNGGNGQILIDSIDRNYFVIDNAAGNPHFIAPTAKQSRDNVVAQNVLEGHAPDLSDVGDCIIVKDTATAGGFKVVGRNNIVLPSGYTGTVVMSGCLLTLYNAGAAVATEWYRNTGNVNNSTIASKRGMFAIAEAGTGTAGQVAQLKSNIAWGGSASQGYLGERVSGNVKDIITAANADRNWTYNTSAGDNQRGYEDTPATNTLWTAGDAVAAGVDANGGSGDPQFVDSSRNLASWAVARGYGADYAAGLTAILANPRRTEDLIDYVFEGFKVANASIRNAAHDGGAVGAANYHKASRLLTDITNFRSYANTKYGVTV